MESLFKLTELENRVSLNMNVLSHGKVPNVLSLGGVLKEWLEHRKEVLVRRSEYRLAEIEKRLEILGGFLKAYLNLDEVIRIIREEDEPKQELMRFFDLTDNQAEAILNMRLRSLRKLEVFEIGKVFDGLTNEKPALEGLLASGTHKWKKMRTEIKAVRVKYGLETILGKRYSSVADAQD